MKFDILQLVYMIIAKYLMKAFQIWVCMKLSRLSTFGDLELIFKVILGWKYGQNCNFTICINQSVFDQRFSNIYGIP